MGNCLVVLQEDLTYARYSGKTYVCSKAHTLLLFTVHLSLCQ